MNWTKQCSDCGQTQEYSWKQSYTKAVKSNSKCYSCRPNHWLGGKHTLQTKNKISSANKNQEYNKSNLGKRFSESHRRKIAQANIRNKSRTGMPHLPETKLKMRLSAIARIERVAGQAYPRYNPLACRIIEKYGKLHGYNFQHAENGGEVHIKELGYWVDGYDTEQNVVIEYHESYHNRQVEKDKQRQQEIIEYLECKFIIINEEESWKEKLNVS